MEACSGVLSILCIFEYTQKSSPFCGFLHTRIIYKKISGLDPDKCIDFLITSVILSITNQNITINFS